MTKVVTSNLRFTLTHQRRTETQGYPISTQKIDETSLIAVHSVIRPSTMLKSDWIVELLTGKTISGFDGIENPLPMSSSRVSMNCNRPMALEQTETRSEGVIEGVGRSVSRGPVIPVISPRRLTGTETGMMLEIGGTATGRDEIPPSREANTPDAAGGTAMGLPVGTNPVIDTIGSELVGSLSERTAVFGRVGMANCRASWWPGAGLAEARRTDVSKVRFISMSIMLMM